MKFKKNKSYQIDIGPYPFEIYYCPTEKSWDRLMGEWGDFFKDQKYPMTKGGHCTVFNHPNFRDRCIITFDNNHPDVETVGIIAHESTHAVDFLIESIGEETVGKEFRAYTTQWLTQSIYHIWKGLK